MVRLQDLVDKLQVKVKSYKRQAEEAVSPRDPRAAPGLFPPASPREALADRTRPGSLLLG